MAKPKKKLLKKRDRAAPESSKRERAEALRARAARLEAEAEEDGVEGDSAPPRSALARLRDAAAMATSPSDQLGALARGLFPQVASLAGLGRLVVTDQTPGDAEGGPGFEFQRSAGRVDSVELDRNGRPVRTVVKVDDWPPRGEKF